MRPTPFNDQPLPYLFFSTNTVEPGSAEFFFPRYFVVSSTIVPLDDVPAVGTLMRGSE